MKLGWSVLALGVACLACCAPLIVAGLSGLALGAAAWTGSQWLLVGALAAVAIAAGVGIWASMRKRGRCACEAQCEVGKCNQP